MRNRNEYQNISRALSIAILIVAIPVISLYAQENQETEKAIQKGNDLYKAKQYDQAETAYKEVLNREKTNTTAAFNHANALFRQTKLDENKTALDEVIMNSDKTNTELKGKAYYNQGVGYSIQKNLEASIDAYKNALRQNPNDKEARENLQKALMELKKRNPPPPPKEKKNQQKKQQKQQPKMDQKEAEQRLKLLEQKEKEVQQRLQNEKSKAAAGQPKDW
jgi:Ca-activated chloride channel family protein